MRVAGLGSHGQGMGVLFLIRLPSLVGLQSVLKVVQFMKSLQVPPVAGMRLRPFPSPSVGFLGKFQFRRVHCFNRLIAKRRGTCVSL